MPPALIPEFSVSDIAASLRFYRDILGWQIVYDRPEEEFAYLRMGGADLMIDGLNVGRNFDTTLTATDHPFGRGASLQIEVADITPLLTALSQADYPLHLPLEEKWYRSGREEIGQRQFIVADPDGYLLRFCQALGRRPIRTGQDANAL